MRRRGRLRHRACVGLGAVLASTALCGCRSPVEQQVQGYHQHQVQGLVSAYEQARIRGDLLDQCVKSNLIAGAYLDARDPGNARAWEARRSEDCRVARETILPHAAP